MVRQATSAHGFPREESMTREQYLDFLRSLHDNASLDVQPNPDSDEENPVANIDADGESSRISVIDDEIADVMSSNESDFSTRKNEFMRTIQYT